MFGEEHFSNQYAARRVRSTRSHGSDLISVSSEVHTPGEHDDRRIGRLRAGSDSGKAGAGVFRLAGRGTRAEDVPAPAHQPKPGVYVVHKGGGQSGPGVPIGHLGALRGTPDEFALQVMNGDLGASGFHRVLVSRVRSDEGLAY